MDRHALRHVNVWSGLLVINRKFVLKTVLFDYWYICFQLTLKSKHDIHFFICHGL